jgi:phosphatidate cytidylyltransferase
MSEHDNGDNRADGARAWGARLGEDFGTRLLSGLVMGAVAALFTWWGVTPFSILVVLGALIVSWEWGRLVHGREADLVIAVHVVAAGASAVLAAVGQVGLALLALPIGAILATVLSIGRNSAFSALGVFYAGLPAIALIWLRSDPKLGLLAVVYLVVIVIAADTAAFLAGRLLGGPRLWPSVSPNKTWAGLIGALIAGSVVGALFWFVVPGGSAVWLGAAGALLALVAQGGDLVESALKRRFGAKDASSLIPGHGGVMDRVDGLVAAASVVLLVALAINVHSPARALLLGS